MTIREKAKQRLEAYCEDNNLILSSDEYDEMLFKLYSKYMDELLTNPPKSKRKNGLR